MYMSALAVSLIPLEEKTLSMIDKSPRSEGSSPTVFTFGHGQGRFEEFTDALAVREITLVVDVRSKPWLKWAKQFNKEEMEALLPRAGIEYLWLGEHLGGRPDGDQFYDADDHALYQPISEQPWFLKAIGQVEYEAERRGVALVCVEELPEKCHRYHLLGRVLREREMNVAHIRRNGASESQSAVAERIGEGQASLLGATPVWRSPEPQREPAA
jgi:uncharacterized protein (DUF488 family)